MINEEAIKELRDASDSEVRYGDTKNHYDEVMRRVEAFDMAIKALEQQSCDDAISRDETLKAFAEKCGGECGCCVYNGSGYDSAENCKLIKSMPSVTPKTVTDFADKCQECGKIQNELLKNKWIPVSERLPEDYIHVLCQFTLGGMGECYLAHGVFHVVGGLVMTCNEVIAWTPLPEPYKAESEE